ncbi:hypothetical protein [Streptomyces cylindrosporus]|uniref:Holin n=1 Tax=Streptomyces cylindrosporus TaxID=2927583 RepID=A0ABS9YJV6_9ACTN|nr:hypothetical protein [Streptomyces cylindrosporus]MCI3277543.1 hypothetical protein [Streptomyces cylindrosporus]
MKVSRMWKAIVGGAAAATAAAGTAVQDGALTTAEVVTIVLAAVGGLGIVWKVPNRGTKDSA